MSDLRAFLKQNKKESKTVLVEASESFRDEQGNVLKWEIRPLKSKEAENIRMQCVKISKKGVKSIDSAKFNCKVAVACTVFPNLHDQGLQDSYGVMGAEQLIQEMLDVDGEYQRYVEQILKISGYDKSMDDLVDEAKN